MMVVFTYHISTSLNRNSGGYILGGGGEHKNKGRYALPSSLAYCARHHCLNHFSSSSDLLVEMSQILYPLLDKGNALQTPSYSCS